MALLNVCFLVYAVGTEYSRVKFDDISQQGIAVIDKQTSIAPSI